MLSLDCWPGRVSDRRQKPRGVHPGAWSFAQPSIRRDGLRRRRDGSKLHADRITGQGRAATEICHGRPGVRHRASDPSTADTRSRGNVFCNGRRHLPKASPRKHLREGVSVEAPESGPPTARRAQGRRPDLELSPAFLGPLRAVTPSPPPGSLPWAHETRQRGRQTGEVGPRSALLRPGGRTGLRHGIPRRGCHPHGIPAPAPSC